MKSEFQIRFATPADVETISWHRARMFQDMGMLTDELFESLRDKSRIHLVNLLDSGEYIGWLASASDTPEKIIAGAGVVLRRIPPFPLRHDDGKVTVDDETRRSL